MQHLAHPATSPPSPLHHKPLRLQFGDDQRAVVALDFYDAVLDGAAGAAGGLEGFAEGGEGGGVQRDAFDDGDALAAAALGFARDAHDAVTGRCAALLGADALRDGLAAAGAGFAVFGGIDECALGAGGDVFRAHGGAHSGRPACGLPCAARA